MKHALGRHGLGLALTLAAMGLASCGTSAPPAGDSSSSAGPAGGAAADGMAVLREAADLEPREVAMYFRVAEKCMTTKGFQVHPARGQDAAAKELFTPPYASPSSQAAAKDGYAINGQGGQEPETVKPADAFDALPAAERARYQEAMTGLKPGESPKQGPDGRPMRGGCLGEAHTAMYGTERRPSNPIPEIDKNISAGLSKDPQLTAALAKWSQCVEAAGFPKLADPADAHRYAEYFHFNSSDDARTGGAVPKGGPWPFAEARKREIALATADARCADQHGLREAQSGAWDRQLKDVLSSSEVAIVAYRDALTNAVAKGQRVLQGS